MTTVLVDTNIIIDYLRGKDKQNSLFFKVFGQGKYKAALALRNKLPLLTLNEKDFQSIKGIALFQPDN